MKTRRTAAPALSAAQIRRLEKAARAAAKKSYSPYSEFPVGAAIVCGSGQVFTGCNVENASYGLCNCAERTAIFSAAATGERVVTAVVVYTPTPTPSSPCGACRQVMLETETRFKQPMRVLLYGKKGIYELKNVGELLPLSFDASAMK